MLAIASKPRGVRSWVRETKLPAALLMRSVSGPCGEDGLDHLVDRERVADIDAVGCHPAAIEVHQFGRGFVADALAAAADMDLGAEFEETRGHGFAEAASAAGDKDAPSSKELFSEHGWFPPKGIVC